MVQATDVCTTKYELYSALTWVVNVEHLAGIVHFIQHFQGQHHHQYILCISLFCLPFFFFFLQYFFFYCLTPCWVCMCVVLWVDVQTGCVWAGVPLSVHLFAALILGFVCSIWAKFSNGDNYRGRPGERRRWVLPFYRVSCMLLQASQLHLPAFLVSLSISVTVFVIKGPVLSYRTAIHSDCSFSD